jgi:hypothetical protein
MAPVSKNLYDRAMFTKRQYVDYLIATTGNYTCANLADHLEGEQAVSHDAISDYLSREKLTPRGLWETVQPLLDDGPDAYLILDDSVQDIHGPPARSLPSFVVQDFVVFPSALSFCARSVVDPSRMKRAKISRTSFASSGLTTSFLFTTSNPSGGVPPIYIPRCLLAATLSRMRSPITSRPNWAKDSSPRDFRPRWCCLSD